MTYTDLSQIKVEELARRLSLELKNKGVFDWVDNNWFMIVGPLALTKKYSLLGLTWTVYSILKNFAEEET